MAKKRYWGLYFKNWLADWTGRMTGGISLVLTIWATFFPPSIQAAKWLLIVAALVSFIVGSYHIWARERRRLDELTKHGLTLEVDQRNKVTTVRVERTNSATRIYLTIKLRFDNNIDIPIYMKELRLKLHRLGDAEEMFLWFALLQVTLNGQQIPIEQFEPMRISEHQLSPFYSVLLMLGTTSDEDVIPLDANYFLQLSMQASGHQPVSTVRLFPYWEDALNEKGTSQIVIIGDVQVIPEDYSRIY
jgi:hypothetical protein